ncbi:anti-sigma-D factor RsdA [Micromonospora deserti]|uniref:Anti-sigma-D factor RsdA sigma factor binding region domain-containing protein n=1 Tax=Micromonospora deserti TaxID=2070366 RepID=A0A2W2BFK8_9ACTN|nr:anti-sigma-D factor RsdA [Micromonospora deserti]PZF84772.1 hypothetical protein C1I99_30135 [Micromonospora deserti]
MREHMPGGGEELDLATIARDDQLLDALGRGEPGPDSDGLAAMLAAWRAEVGGDEDGDHLAEVDPPAVGPRPARSALAGGRLLRLAAAVVALAAIATGLGVSSRTAAPGSPLWSLTRVLYPEHAEVRGVEDTIARARAAVASGDLDTAQQLVDQARGDLPAIDDHATAARLAAELDTVHRDLVEALSGLSPSAPSVGIPAPGSAATQEPAPAVTNPGPAAPKPSAPPSPGGGSLLPGDGPLPLPSLLPESDAPTLLPSPPGLPLATGGPLG